MKKLHQLGTIERCVCVEERERERCVCAWDREE